MKNIISIFFNGTGEGASPLQYEQTRVYSLANLLHHLTKKTHVFPGVAKLHPIRGMLFGTGTDAQCAEALKLIQPRLAANDQVILNLYGHSRGAVTALLLATLLVAAKGKPPPVISDHVVPSVV